MHIVAEKYRSIIQQVIRNRSRRQDVYDLWYLINSCYEFSETEKNSILSSLYKKSEGRISSKKMIINQSTLDNSDIQKRSKEDYHLLKDEVDGEFPEFEIAYETINQFYKSLPWK